MDILNETLIALESEDHVLLATIISTTGSTPAAALSKMLVRQRGAVSVGTVGGGCMEGDVLLHTQRLYDSGKAEILTFHLNEDDIEHGLICGGSLDVLIEPVTKKDVPLIQTLKTIRDEGEDCVLGTYFTQAGYRKFKRIFMGDSCSQWNCEEIDLFDALGLPSNPSLRQSILEAVQKVHKKQETIRFPVSDGYLILEPFGGSPSLIIFGGGHVSKYISRAAAMVGFRITIVDDRDKFANSGRFPEAAQTLAMDFLEAFDHLTIKPSTYIVIVTRGHRHDEEILENAIATPARYIGMIGSKRKVLNTFEHLVERGISPDALLRVHAPMGIEIGALTAEEIAVSVVAELINERRQGDAQLPHKSDEIKAMTTTIEKNFQHH